MPGRRTQAERSHSTRSALIQAGLSLFTEHGYAGAAADDIVAAAGVTRGALYHHFGSKQGLFQAVFEQLEADIVEQVSAQLADGDDLWVAAEKGLAAFLDVCVEPSVIRIALQDAPAVLGWEQWRATEAQYGLGLILATLTEAQRQRLLQDTPVEPLAQLILGAVTHAALDIAHASQPHRRRQEVQAALITMFNGLRATAGETLQ